MQVKSNQSHLAESVERVLEILEKREPHKVTNRIYKDALKFSGLELGLTLVSEVANA